MKTFVITWNELYRGDYVSNETTWHGEDIDNALRTFYESFDDADRKKVSSVRIFSLVEFVGDTSYVPGS